MAPDNDRNLREVQIACGGQAGVPGDYAGFVVHQNGIGKSEHPDAVGNFADLLREWCGRCVHREPGADGPAFNLAGHLGANFI